MLLESYNPEKYVENSANGVKLSLLEEEILWIEYECLIDFDNSLIADSMEEAIECADYDSEYVVYYPLEKMDKEHFIESQICRISGLISSIRADSFERDSLKLLDKSDCLFRLFRAKNKLDQIIEAEKLRIPYYNGKFSEDFEYEQFLKDENTISIDLSLSDKDLNKLSNILNENKYLNCSSEEFKRCLVKTDTILEWLGKQKDFAYFCSCFSGLVLNPGMENKTYKLIGPKFKKKNGRKFNYQQLSSQTNKVDLFFQNLMKDFLKNRS